MTDFENYFKGLSENDKASFIDRCFGNNAADFASFTEKLCDRCSGYLLKYKKINDSDVDNVIKILRRLEKLQEISEWTINRKEQRNEYYNQVD